MDVHNLERLRSIRTFPSLVKYLRDELDWPVESENFEELTFEYEPEELGLEPKIAVKIKEIKQLRPFITNQPWGIFFINFEPKRLPVVVLRRVLRALVIKKRQSLSKADQKFWKLHDLLFVSSYGESEDRSITFAHFSDSDNSGLPTLKVIGWDYQDTPLHLDQCAKELEKLKFSEDLSSEDWRKQWVSAFSLEHREVITTSKALAERLAVLATKIRRRVNAVLKLESEKGPIRKLYKAFQETLIHDLSEDDFADMYAQTITYGLFSARCSREADFIAENLSDMIPIINLFLKELLSTFLTIGGRKGKIDFDELGINDVVQMLRDANMEAVKRDFDDKNPEHDPVIHFYEDFLKQYDAKKKTKRGVFYTPKPVVSFIVRSVDEILRKDFGLEDGLADIATWGQMQNKNKDIKIPKGVSENEPFVQILDPAVGTGTFLVEVIDIIHKTMLKKWEKEGHLHFDFNKLWNQYVPNHLLPRLYGFELMMAPYAIAHMKIGLKLFETGYQFGTDERARIYLTNSLEPPQDFSDRFEFDAPALAHEAKAVNKVKRQKHFTVVIGNPPYAYESVNNGQWITSLVRDYYQIDGRALDERNPKGLQDDYVKFLRFAQWVIEEIGIGIVGMITNHAFLDNPTFRGMRQQLMKSFSKMHLLDLHGNAKKKEICPDGSKDENVFDIQQGVGVSLFLKEEESKSPKISHSEFWGLRHNKYEKLVSSIVGKIDKLAISPGKPFYLFVPQDTNLQEEYVNGWKIVDIFPVNSAGLFTSRDGLTIHHKPEEVWEVVNDFVSLPENEAREKYMLPPDVIDWKVSLAQQDIRTSGPEKNCIVPILYRPFDIRFTYYSGRSRGFLCRPRSEVMHHMIGNENLGLITVRQVAERNFNHVFATHEIVECRITLSNKGYGYLFPLYLYPLLKRADQHLMCGEGTNGRNANLAPKFIEDLERKNELSFVPDGQGDFKKTFGPDDVFYYIYAVFHSPTYRSRYAEFLKIDFPRVPVISDTEMFRKLVLLGSELTGLHLMESDKLNSHITTFPVSGDNAVTKVGEKGKALADVKTGKGKLFINKNQYFDNLPEEVWNFHIGGYQVCYKWLKDRKGRKLSKEDIEHYHKIVVALNETIKIMKQIDEVIAAHGAWPNAFSA